MNKEFIPYEQALALKELGFDEPCFAFYNHNRELLRYMNPDKDWNSLFNQTLRNSKITLPDTYTAPTFSQAFRWFREKYRYNCFITSSKLDGKWYYFREDLDDRWNDSEPELTPKFDSYEEAELACLQKLIEIIKK